MCGLRLQAGRRFQKSKDRRQDRRSLLRRVRNEIERSACLRGSFEKAINHGPEREICKRSDSVPADDAAFRRTTDRSFFYRALFRQANVLPRQTGRVARCARKNIGGIQHGNEKIITCPSHCANTVGPYRLYGARHRAGRVVRSWRSIERTFVASPTGRFVRHSPLHRS